MTTIKIMNADINHRMTEVRNEVRALLQMTRYPGVQYALDFLLDFYLSQPTEDRVRFLREWKTEVIGYPNSKHNNPGSFCAPQQPRQEEN